MVFAGGASCGAPLFGCKAHCLAPCSHALICLAAEFCPKGQMNKSQNCGLRRLKPPQRQPRAPKPVVLGALVCRLCPLKRPQPQFWLLFAGALIRGRITIHWRRQSYQSTENLTNVLHARHAVNVLTVSEDVPLRVCFNMIVRVI